MLSNEELIVLTGILIYPEMIPDIDFSLHEVTNSMFKAMEYLHSLDIENVFEGGIVTALMNMKRKGIIKQDDYAFLFDGYGNKDINTMEVVNAVAYIKEEAQKQAMNEKLSIIDFEKESKEDIIEMVNEIVSDYNTEATTEDITETFKDVLPRSGKAQKSLVSFKHNDMQSAIAVDSNYLVVIGARPGTGKTTFAVKLVMDNVSSDKVLYISCEMTKEQIVRKSKFYLANHKNAFIEYRSVVSIADISKMISRIKPKFVIIDQLNKVVGKGRTEYERFTYVANKLKILASKKNTPIICLAQINRGSTDNKRPMIHHLKGSGSIEEESDIVMILNIEKEEPFNEYYTRVYVDKNRSLDGRTGYFDFNFDIKTNIYCAK